MAKNRKRKPRLHAEHAKTTTSPDDRPWAIQEIDFMREGFKPERAGAIARTLNRSLEAVRGKAAELEVCHQRPWTDWDLEYVVRHCPDIKPTELAKRLSRKVAAIRVLVHRLTQEGQLEKRIGHWSRWTPQEIAILRRCNDMPLPELAEKLGRTQRAIIGKQRSLGLCEPTRKYWTAEEVAHVQAEYQHLTTQAIATQLGRSKASVDMKVRHLGLHKAAPREVWQPSETAYLEQHLNDLNGHRTHYELAEHLGRGVDSVRRKMRRLGLEEFGGWKAWHPQETRYLKDHYGHKTYREIAAHLGRTEVSIQGRMRSLRIRKRPEAVQGKPVPWQPEEVDYIRRHYREQTTRELARHLNRTYQSVENKLISLRLLMR